MKKIHQRKCISGPPMLEMALRGPLPTERAGETDGRQKIHNLKKSAQNVVHFVLGHMDLHDVIEPTKNLRNWSYKKNKDAMPEKQAALSEHCLCSCLPFCGP